MKILISGFEPFGNHQTNSSQDLVLALEKENLGIETIILPVSFEDSFKRFKDKIDRYKPDIAICTGMAEGRDHLTPERIAINFTDARIPDNDGDWPRDQSIIPDAPDGIFSPLPLKEMVGACEKLNIPAKVSDSAGNFVCNHLMYQVLHYSKEVGFQAGFIHLPPTTKMPIRQSLKGFKAILSVLHNL